MDEIQFCNDLVLDKDSISYVIRLFPINVFSLDQREQEIFLKGLEALLRSIKEDSIKISIKIRRLNKSDVEGHFENISKGACQRKISEYIDELMSFINLNHIPFKEYNLIVSEKGTGPKNIMILHRRVENLKRHLNALGIGTNILRGNKLKDMITDYI